MAPVGRRLAFDDADNDDRDVDQAVIADWERRTVRVEFCRLRLSDFEFIGSY